MELSFGSCILPPDAPGEIDDTGYDAGSIYTNTEASWYNNSFWIMRF